MLFKRIRNLREDADLTQKDVCKILNISQSTYSDIENGVINIQIDTLIQIANFYHVSIDYLLERTNKKNIK